jgi:hypothetical protein
MSSNPSTTKKRKKTNKTSGAGKTEYSYAEE